MSVPLPSRVHVMPLCLICLTGGVFKLYLQFSEHYDGQPPEIFFHTIPFHPNGKLMCLFLMFKNQSSVLCLKIIILIQYHI